MRRTARVEARGGQTRCTCSLCTTTVAWSKQYALNHVRRMYRKVHSRVDIRSTYRYKKCPQSILAAPHASVACRMPPGRAQRRSRRVLVLGGFRFRCPVWSASASLALKRSTPGTIMIPGACRLAQVDQAVTGAVSKYSSQEGPNRKEVTTFGDDTTTSSWCSGMSEQQQGPGEARRCRIVS